MAALATMAFSSTGAHAALNSLVTLSIENDAVTSWNASSSSFYVSSNGPQIDSFFTMGGSKTKQMVETQFAYLTGEPVTITPENWFDYRNGITLSGATQSNIATFTYYDMPGSLKTAGIGLSILSASGDTATINMSGLKMNWYSVQDISLGSGAWSPGYTNSVGYLTCSTGSGCAAGSDFTLKYTATIPVGDPSGFGSVKFYLELHGCVNPLTGTCTTPTIPTIPEASTYAMMLAGLGLVGAMARRRKLAKI